jgi:hypothetical protein
MIPASVPQTINIATYYNAYKEAIESHASVEFTSFSGVLNVIRVLVDECHPKAHEDLKSLKKFKYLQFIMI